MQKRYVFLTSIFVIFFIAGCSLSEKPKQGKIVYSIEFLQDENQMPIIALLPKEVTAYFKGDQTSTVIDGFWGTFEIRFITDYRLGKNYTYLRIMNKKYVYEADTNTTPPGYEEMGNIKIVLNEEKGNYDTVINNLNCYKALVYSPIFGDKPAEFYYTYDIDIKNPNANTPFYKIKGVLVAFQVRLVGIDMKFKIKQIDLNPVDDKYFQLPSKGTYESMTKDELEKLFKSFTE